MAGVVPDETASQHDRPRGTCPAVQNEACSPSFDPRNARHSSFFIPSRLVRRSRALKSAVMRLLDPPSRGTAAHERSREEGCHLRTPGSVCLVAQSFTLAFLHRPAAGTWCALSPESNSAQLVPRLPSTGA